MRQKAPRGPRGTAEARRATASHSGPQRGTASHSEPQRPTATHSEPQRHTAPAAGTPKAAIVAPATLLWKPFIPKGCPGIYLCFLLEKSVGYPGGVWLGGRDGRRTGIFCVIFVFFVTERLPQSSVLTFGCFCRSLKVSFFLMCCPGFLI